MTDDHSERALRRLVDEAREDATPELDWNAIESSLLARVEGAAPGSTRRSSRRSWVVPVALAATLGGALLFRFVDSPSRDPLSGATRPSSAQSRGGSVDGDALAAGARVISGDEAVVVQHVGHVTWTLAPNGAAHIESVGAVIGVSLDRGTVSARVTKSTQPESFVIRVENSRIAVHGTAFRVERGDFTVKIEVTEGVVAIGPVGGAAFELRAPGQAVVSFDGVGADAPRPLGGATRVRPPTVSALGAPPGGGTSEGPARNATGNELRDGSVRAASPAGDPPSLEHVIQSVRHCLSDHTIAGGDLRVTVRTRMSLRVQPSGHVGEALFDPPLAPPVQECVDTKVGSIEFSASRAGFALDRVIELER